MPTVAPPRLFPRQALGGLFPREVLRPDASTGSTTAGLDGTVFLPDELAGARLVVRAAFGADPATPPGSWTYTDITSDVLQDNGRTISIRVARANWKTLSQPAMLTLGLKNLTGRYTANNALSPLWPYLTQGVPIQVQLWIANQYWDRFDGETVGWRPALDSTGNWSTVILTAAGTLRRIGGGNAQPPPLHSALYRSIIVLDPAPVAYWSLEDGTAATSLASAVGGSPMVLSGDGDFGSGSASGLAGSAPLATPASGSVATGQVPAFPASWTTASGWAVWWVMKIPRVPAADTVLMAWRSADSSAARWQVVITSGGLIVTKLYNSAGVEQLGDTGTDLNLSVLPGGTTNYGRWLLWAAYAAPDGGDTSVVTQWGVAGNSVSDINFIAAHEPGAPTSVTITGAASSSDSFSLGHVVVRPTWLDILDATVAFGYVGETVSERLTRLALEEGIPLTQLDTDTTQMGAQPVDTLLALLRECEATGAGFLYDGPGQVGLTYQPLAVRYNAPALLTLDASVGQIQPPYGLEDDDFERVNRSTVTSRDGSTAVYEDTTGPLGTGRIPTYPGTPPVQPNFASSDQGPGRAAWEVHKGTVPGFRYPSITVNWRKIPAKIPAWLQTLPGWPLTITPPYAGILPTGDIALVVEGWQEDLAKLQWTTTMFTSRGDPYQVGVVGNGATPASARVASVASTVASDVTAGASSISVAVASGPLWTTDSAFYPQDLWIDGLRVTVTAMAGVSSPQTATVDPADVTRAIPAGRTVHPWASIEASL